MIEKGESSSEGGINSEALAGLPSRRGGALGCAGGSARVSSRFFDRSQHACALAIIELDASIVRHDVQLGVKTIKTRLVDL